MSWSLASEPGAPGIAREIASGVLREWGMGGFSGDVQIVVSELVTNALRHGTPPESVACGCGNVIRMSMLRREGELVCAVRDQSDRLPVRREPDFLLENGRGLQLVACFAAEWGALPVQPRGKYVWARFG